MKQQELRKKFEEFFKKKGHKLVAPASLVFEKDPSVLFTSAGMQQFKDFYLQPKHAPAANIITIQPCFRTSDIEEVGDSDHLTFFEMMGNFSFDEYFKKEAIEYAFEFVTKVLKIPKSKIFVSVFRGEKDPISGQAIPLDRESVEIWRNLGISDSKIKMNGLEDNFWGPTGKEGPCGPTTEIYVGETELWNIVFNQYYKSKDGRLAKSKYTGVDTGMGLERLAQVMQGKKDIFETDLFLPILGEIKKMTEEAGIKEQRIIADHIRAIVFLASEGVMPSNKERGYVLRRLIRRAVANAKMLKIKENILPNLAKIVIDNYSSQYPILDKSQERTLSLIKSEESNFNKTLSAGIREFEKVLKGPKKIISGIDVFRLYDTFGFPFELMEQMAKQNDKKIAESEFRQELEKQRQRARQAQKFRSQAPNARLHTATHLLHRALRDVLGQHVQQAGSDISGDELRFDFTHSQKLTDGQIKKIEEIVNEKIKQNLPVKAKETTLEKAKKEGAIALFDQKYGDKVTQYSVGDYSKELCGGPHVKKTGEIGKFVITHEKSSASGVRRIKAKVE